MPKPDSSTLSPNSGSHSYIDNVRWYLDDEYYDHDAVDNVKYTLNDDGTISATNNEWTFDDTVNVYNGEYVETESTYAPAEGEIDGVSGAWKYAPVTVTRPDKDDPSKNKTVFSSWENQLKLVSATDYKNGSTGDNGYNVNGMRNLTEGIAKKVGAPVNDSVESKYKFVTFDLYVENGDSFNLNLNHVNIGGRINLGTTMAEEGYVDGGTDSAPNPRTSVRGRRAATNSRTISKKATGTPFASRTSITTMRPHGLAISCSPATAATFTTSTTSSSISLWTESLPPSTRDLNPFPVFPCLTTPKQTVRPSVGFTKTK
ncbi:MAG: hypothetical protein ACLUSP_03165 [Christensenellales bacterium]